MEFSLIILRQTILMSLYMLIVCLLYGCPSAADTLCFINNSPIKDRKLFNRRMA